MSLKLPLEAFDLEKARRMLLSKFSEDLALPATQASDIRTLEDGDMGSFAVVDEGEQTGVEKIAATYDYVDSDQMGVLITAYCRAGQRISSVDFWRHDFGALKAIPEPNDLVRRQVDTDPISPPDI